MNHASTNGHIAPTELAMAREVATYWFGYAFID